MTLFATELEAIESEIRELPMTWEAITPPEMEAMTEEDRELSDACFLEAKQGKRDAIQALRFLIKKYPKVAVLKNHLMIAYSAAGKKSRTNKVAREISLKHPDYLFGRISRAQAWLDSANLRKRVPELLGETLRLRDAAPGRSAYHMSEVRSYYAVVALFHLKEGRTNLATKIHNTLLDLSGEGDQILGNLRAEIFHQNLLKIQDRIKSDEERAIRVRTRPANQEAQPELFTPDMFCPEIRALYEHGLDLPEEKWKALQALPRSDLVEGLEAVLRDSIQRGEDYMKERVEWAESEVFFPIHALALLGDMKSTQSLPAVLEVLSQPYEWLDWWSGDMFSSFLWQPLYQLMESQLDAVEEWMLQPGVPARGRGLAGDAIKRVAVFQPERRGEVLDWFRRVLEFLRDSPPEHNILDTDLVTSLVCALCDIQAIELRDLIFELEAKGYISEMMLGGREEIESALNEPLPPEKWRPPLELPDLYREMNDVFGGQDSPEEADYDEDLLDTFPEERALAPCRDEEPDRDSPFYPVQQPYKAPPKVGRNEPCPCGSGKKYKKCCG